VHTTNELESSLTLAFNALTVTPDLRRHLDLHWALLRQTHDEFDSTPGAAALAEAELAQFRTLYEEYEMNLLRENDAPMSLNLPLPPVSIPEFNGEYLDWPRFHDLLVEFHYHGPTGQLQTCRAVIHAGSQVNLISRRIADLLSLKEMSPIEISGIGGKLSTATRSKLKLSSCTSGLETLLDVFIMPTVITD